MRRAVKCDEGVCFAVVVVEECSPYCRGNCYTSQPSVVPCCDAQCVGGCSGPLKSHCWVSLHRATIGLNHGERRDKSPRIWSGDANAMSPDFLIFQNFWRRHGQKYRSEFTKNTPFQAKNSILSEQGLSPSHAPLRVRGVPLSTHPPLAPQPTLLDSPVRPPEFESDLRLCIPLLVICSWNRIPIAKSIISVLFQIGVSGFSSRSF